MKNIENFRIISGTAAEIEQEVAEYLAHPAATIISHATCIRSATVAAAVPAQAVDAPSRSESEPFHISDAAEKLAKDNNLDLSTVTGTGKDNGITKSDVEAALTTREEQQAEQSVTLQSAEYHEEVVHSFCVALCH